MNSGVAALGRMNLGSQLEEHSMRLELGLMISGIHIQSKQNRLMILKKHVQCLVSVPRSLGDEIIGGLLMGVVSMQYEGMTSVKVECSFSFAKIYKIGAATSADLLKHNSSRKVLSICNFTTEPP